MCLNAAFAQNGNRKGHDNMNPVVPAEMVPAAPILSPEQALKSFEIQPGFTIELFASEPLIDKPVCSDFDPSGRMWLCEMRGYMLDIDGMDENIPIGRIVVLEDTDHDGKADKRTVFLDQVHLPRAVAVYGDGVLYLDDTRLMWIKRDGLKPIGEPKEVASHFVEAGNVEHKANALMSNLDNWHYNAKLGKRVRRDGDQWLVEATPFRGQWGISRDDYGRLYHNNNSTLLFGDFLAPNLLQGNPGVNLKISDASQLGSNAVWPARVTPGVNRAYIAKKNGYDSDTLDPVTFKLTSATAAAGFTIYRGSNFPKEWQGRAFVTESSVNLVKVIDLKEADDQLKGTHPLGKKEFLTSTDERFRPVNLTNAPDGSMLLLDMYHGIIQDKFFMTTYLREQYLSRGLDKPGTGHGRIWRIRATKGALEKPVDLSRLDTAALLPYLGHANSWHREQAQRELVNRHDVQAKPGLMKIVADSSRPLAQIHALWTLEGLKVLDAAAVKLALNASEPKVKVSALWAASKLTSAQLQSLEDDLLKFSPTSLEQRIYLTRVLGAVGLERTDAALVTMLQQNGKQKFIKEAAFSGLDGRETKFKDLIAGKWDQADFVKWLDQGASTAGVVMTAGMALKGGDLASFERGKTLYSGVAACFGCHGASGEGVPNLGPPLDESEYVVGPADRLAKILLHGLTGPVTVKGVEYRPTADMPGLIMNPLMKDSDLADIATYIRNEWSNSAAPVAPEIFAKWRKETADRTGRPYRASDLK